MQRSETHGNPSMALDDLPEPRNFLRQSTRDWHTRLDTHGCVAGLARVDASAQCIRHGLLGLATAHERLRLACKGKERLLEAGLNDAHLEAVRALSVDLERFPSEAVAPSYFPPSVPQRLPERVPYGSAAEQLGVSYVVLGSALGSKKIATGLRNHDDPWVRSISYFEQLAGITGSFVALIQALQTRLLTHAQLREAAVAANMTYACFVNSMDDVLTYAQAENSHAVLS